MCEVSDASSMKQLPIRTYLRSKGKAHPACLMFLPQLEIRIPAEKTADGAVGYSPLLG
jgi:hypothetical protein